MRKKILAASLIFAMAVSMTACGGTTSEVTEISAEAEDADNTYEIEVGPSESTEESTEASTEAPVEDQVYGVGEAKKMVL